MFGSNTAHSESSRVSLFDDILTYWSLSPEETDAIVFKAHDVAPPSPAPSFERRNYITNSLDILSQVDPSVWSSGG